MNFLPSRSWARSQLLAGEADVGAGGLRVGLGLGAAAGHAHGGALDLGAQQRQNLALHYPVAALDQQLLHHPDHRRAHLGHLLRLDQTAQRLGAVDRADSGQRQESQSLERARGSVLCVMSSSIQCCYRYRLPIRWRSGKFRAHSQLRRSNR